MKALGMIEVYSFTTAVCVADLCAKAADIQVIAFNRNRPKSADAPAPLVMQVKIEGSVDAVRAAVEAGKKFAQDEGKYIVSHIIPRPGKDVEKLAYLLDMNKDKYNKKLPKSFLNSELELPETDFAIGMIEISGLVASVTGLDAMLKAADVRLIHSEKRLGGRLVTWIVKGSVSAVKAAVDAGIQASKSLGELYGEAVIPRPHGELMKFFDFETE